MDFETIDAVQIHKRDVVEIDIPELLAVVDLNAIAACASVVDHPTVVAQQRGDRQTVARVARGEDFHRFQPGVIQIGSTKAHETGTSDETRRHFEAISGPDPVLNEQVVASAGIATTHVNGGVGLIRGDSKQIVTGQRIERQGFRRRIETADGRMLPQAGLQQHVSTGCRDGEEVVAGRSERHHRVVAVATVDRDTRSERCAKVYVIQWK